MPLMTMISHFHQYSLPPELDKKLLLPFSSPKLRPLTLIQPMIELFLK
jgi:hypothetical protein